MQSKDQIIKREKMFALIEEWQQSGQSQRQFCIKNDIPYHIFIYYNQKYKQQHIGNEGGFLPMEITNTSSHRNSGEIEVHYDNLKYHFKLGSINYYFFDREVVDSLNWQEISEKYLVLKRVTVNSIEQLDSMNWEITYP
jgi:hypothetical protein